MSDTQAIGWTAPNTSWTTALPRLGRMTCSTASVPTKTHSHQVWLFTRAEVSSEATTSLATTACWMVEAAATSGSRDRANMLLIAPSLMVSANISAIRAHRRSSPMACA